MSKSNSAYPRAVYKLNLFLLFTGGVAFTLPVSSNTSLTSTIFFGVFPADLSRTLFYLSKSWGSIVIAELGVILKIGGSPIPSEIMLYLESLEVINDFFFINLEIGFSISLSLVNCLLGASFFFIE